MQHLFTRNHIVKSMNIQPTLPFDIQLYRSKQKSRNKQYFIKQHFHVTVHLQTAL
jgi:hypothetical protein